MTARSRLGGVDRQTLLRVWVLFLLWLIAAMAAKLFAMPSVWLSVAWLTGILVTVLLLRSRWPRFAGFVGFLTAASLAACMAMYCWDQWDWLITTFRADRPAYTLPPTWRHWVTTLFMTAQLLVPLMVLKVHISSRHRLMLEYDDAPAMPVIRWRAAQSIYYLVMPRYR